MTEPIPFDRSFFAAPGELVRLSPLVRRMVAPNPGPMTFTGTCTYVVGQDEVALIDPGPASKEHIAALLAALSTETATAVLVTHTHNDHSPAARALKAATGAKIIAAKVYEGLDPRLAPAAAYSVLAHIENLVSQGLVKTEGALTLGSVFYPG
jgi:glyoxylase-like metal-dependent hydrolase (beta-lactamase superfamily II)